MAGACRCPQPENEYLFRLHFRPPFQWEQLLDFLCRRAIPGVESVESGSYRRTISLNGDSGTLRYLALIPQCSPRCLHFISGAALASF